MLARTHTRTCALTAGTLADPLALVSKLLLRGKCTAEKAERLFALMHEVIISTIVASQWRSEPRATVATQRTVRQQRAALQRGMLQHGRKLVATQGHKLQRRTTGCNAAQRGCPRSS